MDYYPITKFLEEDLSREDWSKYDRKNGTKEISKAIISIARKYNYRCIPEYPAGKINGRGSYIDFVFSSRGRQILSGWNLIAIELDSSNKKNSLMKLEVLKERGFQSVWIRWNTLNKLNIPEGVHLIQL